MTEREGGYIKLHRRLRSSPLWKALRADQRWVTVEILFAANWKGDTAAWHGRVYRVERGELSHTLATLAERAGVGIGVVRSTIDTLLRDHGNGPFLSERFPFSNTASNTGPRILKVVNYERFQGEDAEDSHEPSHRPRTDLAQREEGEEVEEEDHGQQGEILPLRPVPKPRPVPSTSFGRFVSEKWPDIVDPAALHSRLREAYPRVDLEGEARKAWVWEEARPRARKRDHARFLSNWMGNAKPTLAPAATGRREVTGFDEATGKPIYREG